MQTIDKQARQFAAEQLQKAHPHLVPVSVAGSSLVAAAKNIRAELKLAFPETKFSVRSRRFAGGDSIDVSWIDGPTRDQVESIIDKYSAGTFDGMTDCYSYERSAWTDAFGDAKYVHATRENSERAIAAAIRTVFARYSGNLAEVAAPSVEDVQRGRLWNVRVPGLSYELGSLIHQEAARRTWSIAKV
jgi:hypothetical protein